MIPFRSTKFLLVLCIALVATGAVAYALLWFLFAREQSRAATISGGLREVEQARISDASLQTLLSETAPKRARADMLFVGKDGIVAFLKELERAGASAGVKTTVVKVAKKESREVEANLAGAGLETLSVAIEAEGSFAGVHRFLALAERLPRPIVLSRVSFAKGEKEIWSGVFELEVLKIK
ncbi:MAG: hypothetical protein G01um101417_162 [Parcubacteria group bacterium Gr01-1014_17]|nr:MAG: hypothetical protein G01um101417_162 [Parcubacteria group bacterium Gr01-1014_17]